MKITDLWSLHRESFLIQMEGTKEEHQSLIETLDEKWPDREFLVIRRSKNGSN